MSRSLDTRSSSHHAVGCSKNAQICTRNSERIKILLNAYFEFERYIYTEEEIPRKRLEKGGATRFSLAAVDFLRAMHGGRKVASTFFIRIKFRTVIRFKNLKPSPQDLSWGAGIASHDCCLAYDRPMDGPGVKRVRAEAARRTHVFRYLRCPCLQTLSRPNKCSLHGAGHEMAKIDRFGKLTEDTQARHMAQWSKMPESMRDMRQAVRRAPGFNHSNMVDKTFSNYSC